MYQRRPDTRGGDAALHRRPGRHCAGRLPPRGDGLPIGQCDVVQTLEEAAAIVREVGSPFVQTMFDVHNAVDEAEPHASLVDRYFEQIRHVHVNELDGRHCGAGTYDFRPVLDMLVRRGYSGWVSLEAFDFSPGAARIANESLRHLEGVSAGVSI
jgi:D-psicose/D-tagatose/L-ribulose 3-epimerase